MNLTELDPLILIVVMAAMGLVPLLFMIMTSFLKIAVVLVIVRNALGVQQVPPNMVLYGIALALTMYVMWPVFADVQHEVIQIQAEQISSQTVMQNAGQITQPLKDFIKRHSSYDVRDTFMQSAYELWPEEMASSITHDNFVILIPAFVVSELQAGFEIGFLIYLPFVVIDLIVSNLLLALGMQMVAPMTVSLPFKILLFVVAEGWQKLLHGLAISYI